MSLLLSVYLTDCPITTHNHVCRKVIVVTISSLYFLWSSSSSSVSPLTDEELGHFEDTPLSLRLPSNSLQTEHMIWTMTLVADQSTSTDARDGMIRAIEKDRDKKPKVETEADLTFNA